MIQNKYPIDWLLYLIAIDWKQLQALSCDVDLKPGNQGSTPQAD